MSKNMNKRAKSAKKDEPTMNAAMKIFLAGCVAELYLLIVRRFYIRGNALQQIAWYDHYLKYFIILGCVLLLGGAALSWVWREKREKRTAGWILAGGGAFLAVSSGLVLWNMNTITFLSIVVPVVMLLGILWALYDRECAVALTVLGATLILVWLCRRVFSMSAPVKALTVVYLLALVAAAWLLKQGKLGKIMPAQADPLPVYASCALSVIALAIALVSRTAAYYAMWALAIVVFGLVVYYTVKQL